VGALRVVNKWIRISSPCRTARTWKISRRVCVVWPGHSFTRGESNRIRLVYLICMNLCLHARGFKFPEEQVFESVTDSEDYVLRYCEPCINLVIDIE